MTHFPVIEIKEKTNSKYLINSPYFVVLFSFCFLPKFLRILRISSSCVRSYGHCLTPSDELLTGAFFKLFFPLPYGCLHFFVIIHDEHVILAVINDRKLTECCRTFAIVTVLIEIVSSFFFRLQNLSIIYAV